MSCIIISDDFRNRIFTIITLYRKRMRLFQYLELKFPIVENVFLKKKNRTICAYYQFYRIFKSGLRQ